MGNVKERNRDIYEMRQSGVGFTDIGRIFRLSVPRVREIVHKIEHYQRHKMERETDPLFQLYDNGRITTSIYHALNRAGYGKKFDMEWLTDNLKSNRLKPTMIRNLGKKGIAQLRKAL